MPDISYNVRNTEIEQLLRRLGGIIGQQMPDGWGFGLFLFSYGENGAMFWLSSADRADMYKVLQEFIDRGKQ